MTTSLAFNLGVPVGTLLLVAGLVCVGWWVAEHIRAWLRRRARLARKAAKAAALSDVEREFWAIADGMSDLVPDFLLALVGVDTEEESK